MSMAFLKGIPGKLTTFMNYLTSTRAAKLDQLDAAMSSRAAAADYTAGRAAKIDNLDAAVTSRLATCINSIQTGTVNTGTFSSGAGIDTKYVDVTITSVNTAKSVVIINGFGCNAGDILFPPCGRLTSATNLRISAGGFNAGDVMFALGATWQVVEFK